MCSSSCDRPSKGKSLSWSDHVVRKMTLALMVSSLYCVTVAGVMMVLCGLDGWVCLKASWLLVREGARVLTGFLLYGPLGKGCSVSAEKTWEHMAWGGPGYYCLGQEVFPDHMTSPRKTTVQFPGLENQFPGRFPGLVALCNPGQYTDLSSTFGNPMVLRQHLRVISS